MSLVDKVHCNLREHVCWRAGIL